MKNSERKQFNALIGDVMAYYKQDVSAFMFGIWWEALHSFEIEQVSKALSRHATDPERGQFAPKVADIVRVLQGTPTDSAQIAWGKVLSAIQRIGSYRDVVFDDPAIHAVIEDLGGWPKVCMVSYDELSYMQHKFCESHKAYVRQEKFPYPRVLIGERSPDYEYEKRGLKPPKPSVIGNIEAARKVYIGGEKTGKKAFSLADLTEKVKQIAAPV